MSVASALRLLLLAAIWGGSFIFTRIAANAFGPAYLIEARVGFAAISLLIVAIYLKRKLPLLENPKHFLFMGLFNSALPFFLFAYAAQTLNASTLSILNSTAAIWGAIIALFWHKTPLTPKRLIGLMVGIIGVAILVGWDAATIGNEAVLPIFAGIMAAFCYGVATNYAVNAPKVSSFDNAHGSMWAATLLVLPLLPFIPMRETPTGSMMWSVVALGVICTAMAYLIYFRLIQDIGASSTLSVTFLIPVFGILWGNLVLDEHIGVNTVVGTVLVLSGTMLVTGFSVTALFKNRSGNPKV